MTALAAFWARNGTKLLGVLITALAALYTVADDILDLIPRQSLWRGVAKITFGLIGYFVLRRGYSNSRVLTRPPP